MNIFGDLPWTGFEPGTSCSQSDTLPLSQRCSEETDEFSLQYYEQLLINHIEGNSKLFKYVLFYLGLIQSFLNILNNFLKFNFSIKHFIHVSRALNEGMIASLTHKYPFILNFKLIVSTNSFISHS